MKFTTSFSWKRQLVISLLLCLTSQSCIIYNSVKEDSNICELHKLKMKKALVETEFGFGSGSYDYRFPNAKVRQGLGCIVPRWPTYRLAVIYVCRTCDSLQKIYNLQTAQ